MKNILSRTVIKTDSEMRQMLEFLGYDLTDDSGEFDHSLMVSIASMAEKFKWDEINEVWYC
ncbi:hypothetical protein [Ferdinandcohnia sp. SAFN-114]|uniref:hypothetical protein n=1 Tax=Ferdinandcohnia sp. SAFN-114 TaxID=3387275 RepID=UPI003F81F873